MVDAVRTSPAHTAPYRETQIQEADTTPGDLAGAGLDAQALVRRVLAGEGEAYRHLVERESAAVIRACERVLGDRHEAEDAAQEAFVMAYRSLATWRGEGSFGAWLARIAMRIALRQAARRRTVTWLDPTGSTTEPVTGSAVAFGSSAPDPAHLALRAERSVSIRQAVARLGEPYREVVALRFFAERSLAEIAEETGRPLGTVKTHLHRGLLRLREELDRAEVSA